MRTEKQREASRRNGARSRGPITPEGKAKAALNATKHGVSAKTLLLPNEDAEYFDTFRDHLMTDLAPATSYETELALEIISCRWRMRRAWTADTGYTGVTMQAKETALQKANVQANDIARTGFAMGDAIKILNGIRRYESSLARQADAAEKRLAALQHERLAAEPPAGEESPKPVAVPPQPAQLFEPGKQLTPPLSTPVNPDLDKAA